MPRHRVGPECAADGLADADRGVERRGGGGVGMRRNGWRDFALPIVGCRS